MSTAIDRADGPSYDDFRRHFLARKRPVLISGAMDGWPAMRRWDLDYVARRLGDRKITPVIMKDGNFHLDLREGVRVAEMDFAEYRRSIEGTNRPPFYLRLALEGPYTDLLAEDYDAPEYCKRRIFLKKNLWIGGKGAASDLHYDMTHNLVAQVMGRRHVVLFSPEDTANLHPYPMLTLSWHHSQVRVEDPDLARFPRYARARPIELEIERGEMLFIPQGYWHRFASLEDAIAVNFFWLTKRLAPAMAVSRVAWVLSRVRT